jgi:transposase
MRSKGSPAVLEHRRFLAVRRLLDGYVDEEVANFLEVDPRSVRRWWKVFLEHGWDGLAAIAASGRPRKLTPTQEKIALRWLQDSPTVYGFATELWTSRRLAQLIREEWGIDIHPRSLPKWLRARGYTPQKPQRAPRERDPDVIAQWLARDWPRIKKKRFARGRTSFSSMKAGF